MNRTLGSTFKADLKPDASLAESSVVESMRNDEENVKNDHRNIERNTINLSHLPSNKRLAESAFYNPKFFDRRFGPEGLERKDPADEPRRALQASKQPRKARSLNRALPRRTVYESE